MYLLMLFSAFILQTSATAPAGELLRTASATNAADAPAPEEAGDANKKICKSKCKHNTKYNRSVVKFCKPI